MTPLKNNEINNTAGGRKATCICACINDNTKDTLAKESNDRKECDKLCKDLGLRSIDFICHTFEEPKPVKIIDAIF